MTNLIINFWYGRVTLWKSYWIIGELINTVFILLIFNIEIRFFHNTSAYAKILLINFTNFSLISKVVLFIWTIFITVGIWRSAEAYKGKMIWIILTLIFLSYRVFTLRLMLY